MKLRRKGFTLVEVALSTAFVGILSITIVLIINDTVAAYRRGLVLNQVNTTGMDIVDDLRTAVQNSSSRSVVNDCVAFYEDASAVREQCEKDGAYNFISVTKYTSSLVLVNPDSGAAISNIETDVPIYGAFCTGTYSYIWNTGYFESEEARFAEKGTPATLTFIKTGDKDPTTIDSTFRRTEDGYVATDKPFRLLKVRDDNRAVCSSAVRKYNEETKTFANTYTLSEYESISPDFNITAYGTIDEDPVDIILADNNNDLALYELLVPRPAESTTRENTFYSVSFILGTIDGGLNIRASGNSCAPPTDYKNETFDYCAINKFSFAVQANGERF